MEPRDTTLNFQPKWNADALMPVVTLAAETGQMLMLAYANEEALRATLTTGEAHYWSRSRQNLWHKGATSGATQTIVSVEIDCDQDALIYRVNAHGPACHTGEPSCFYRRVISSEDGIISLTKVVE